MTIENRELAPGTKLAGHLQEDDLYLRGRHHRGQRDPLPARRRAAVQEPQLSGQSRDERHLGERLALLECGRRGRKSGASADHGEGISAEAYHLEAEAPDQEAAEPEGRPRRPGAVVLFRLHEELLRSPGRAARHLCRRTPGGGRGRLRTHCPMKEYTLRFGYSPSASYGEAVRLASALPGYVVEDGGRHARHRVSIQSRRTGCRRWAPLPRGLARLPWQGAACR
jgi:hypothetical protein